jgi:hypothetical protein
MTSYIYNMIDTWALSGGPYTSIKMNATDNDAASASLLMDLQVGTVSQFQITKAGRINGPSGTSVNINGAVEIFTSQVRISSTLQFFTDTILTRRAAANLRLGAADTTGTTAPTAQFLSAQSWASSTTNNQTGANFTIDGSQGTGTGAGGSIIFRVAPAGGTSNGVQNALATALTINSASLATFSGSVSVIGGISTGATLSIGGTSVVLKDSGSLVLQILNNAQNTGVVIDAATDGIAQFRLRGNAAFGFVQGKLRTDTAYAAGTVVPTGVLTLYDSTGTAYRVPCLV